MEEEKYLYGAAVQGIQGFIFQTNELKDIIGASELVESICKAEFDLFTSGTPILHAAGNIKHVFDNAEDCKKAVREFPMQAAKFAPGVTVSQAVVKIERGADFGAAVIELEEKLRAQRNKPVSPIQLGLMGIKRSNKTGLPSVEIEGKDYLDGATLKKRKRARKGSHNHKLCDKFFDKNVSAGKIAFDIKDITSNNDWIAIIHADGNGLGQVVQKVGKDSEKFKTFSDQLEVATINAAREAWNQINIKVGENEIIPLRPVVLGGDDLTVICRADFAIEFAQAFLEHFEKQTEELLGTILTSNNVFSNGANKLTACAGIAFIKSSYPFYYGYELAEMLCSQAKKSAKKQDGVLAPSCLMFHKVQDSFVEDFAKIEERELTAGNVSFKYGPYYIDKNCAPSVQELLDNVEKLNSEDGNKVKSHLRQWLSALHEDQEKAEQKKARVMSLLPDKDLFKEVTNLEENKTMAYDLLSLASIKFIKTK